MIISSKNSLWGVAAIVVFLVSTALQISYRLNSWRPIILNDLPGLVGDIIAMTIWIGAGPLAISFLFLIPIKPISIAAKRASLLALLSSVINSVCNYIYNITQLGQVLEYRTVLLNVIALVGASVPIFLILVAFPQILIYSFNRRN